MSLNAIANVTARPGLRAPGGAARLAAGATLLDGHAPAAPQRHRPDRPEARTGVAEPAGLEQDGEKKAHDRPFRPGDRPCQGAFTGSARMGVDRHLGAAAQRLGSALGRFYMGHASGKIADIVLAAPDTASAHDFFLDEGVYARRRFTLAADVQQRERLLNIAFWLDNPPFHNAAHRSGILSLVWMALAIPPIGRQLLPEAIRAIHVGPAPHGWRDHLLNVVRSPLATLQNLTTIVRDRFLAKPRRPGFLIRSAEGRYALHFLAEQAPNGNSRVSLSDTRDALGLPFLAIDIRFSEADARSVVRAHEILDRSLRESGYGRLDYHVPAQERVASVLRQAKDGFHQIGTTRMGVSAEDSVVDADCRVHGIENLYVASSSVFVSSSHANPTFSAVALALRLAAHLSENARAGSLEVAA